MGALLVLWGCHLWFLCRLRCLLHRAGPRPGLAVALAWPWPWRGPGLVGCVLCVVPLGAVCCGALCLLRGAQCAMHLVLYC